MLQENPHSVTSHKKLLTLTMVRNPLNQDILLGMKKRGFGEGKWNGFGGKVEDGESIPEAAVRELKEECGLQAKSLTTVGCIDFEFVNDPIILEVHIFTTMDYTGDVIESDEMRPKWFNITEIPFKEMWLDDSVWIPWYLRGDNFKGYFLYKGFDTIIRHEMNLLTSPPITVELS